MGAGSALFDVLAEVAAVALEGARVFLEDDEQLEDFDELPFGELAAVGDVAQADILGAQLDEDAVQLGVVLDVLDPLLAGDLVERRLGDVDEAAPDQLGHLAVEEGEQQGADVGAVHVGIGHDDDLVVAELLEVEGAFAFAVADAGADGGDHGADFGVLEHLVEAGLLDVDELAADREDGLEAPVAPLLGGAAGGVALDDVDLGVDRVAIGAVGQFAGQARRR